MTLFAERRNKEQIGSAPIVTCKYPLLDSVTQIKYYPSDLHTGIFEHAIDLASFIGEDIYSPVTGLIVDTKITSYDWIAWDESMQGKVNPSITLNWQTIQVYEERSNVLGRKRTVPTDKLVQLCHLQAYSSRKFTGGFVHEGQLLAKVGLSGAITLDENGQPEVHLHIAAFRRTGDELESAKIDFGPSILNPYNE